MVGVDEREEWDEVLEREDLEDSDDERDDGAEVGCDVGVERGGVRVW